MSDSLVVQMDVKGIFKSFDGDIIRIGNEFFGLGDGLGRMRCVQQHLNPVAGRKKNNLINARLVKERLQRSY